MINVMYITRLLIASVCGILIGFERKNRAKEAGVRTHSIVACASCLMMLISIYGFSNISGTNGFREIDPTRIAAQIVSGIGFLGAGMIFVKRQSINGLTTAAGIWATAGVGMAIGAGMYIVGLVTTVIILLTQILFHLNANILKTPKMKVLNLYDITDTNFLEDTRKKLKEHNISIADINISKKNEISTYTLFVEIPHDANEEDILSLFKCDCSIKND